MRILYVTTISLTMNSFFVPHVEMLVRQGHHVDIACNCLDLPVCDKYGKLGCRVYQVDFSRNPLAFDNLRAYRQLKKVVACGEYDIVHCHTPNASVITRLVCRRFRKGGLRVFYTAHGFHFYNGAPKWNWMVYYPIEKICSWFTDVLITINRDDYLIAQKHFRARKVYYVPGVGVDLTRFWGTAERAAIRNELGIPENAKLVLSVGELNENKNHQIVIRAIAEINNPSIHYAIAGIGDKHSWLLDLANELGVRNQVHLLGYRRDIPDLHCAADVFCLPSFREGLPVATIEALASGLPVACSRIRGNRDLVDEQGGKLFDPGSVEECSAALRDVLCGDLTLMSHYNREKAKQYDVMHVLSEMYDIYIE